MNLDDTICYCFHVPLRKLVNYARREQPQRPSQMSDCLGAGTGCGWCIPILTKIHAGVVDAESPQAADELSQDLPASAADYAAARQDYLKTDDKNSF